MNPCRLPRRRRHMRGGPPRVRGEFHERRSGRRPTIRALAGHGAGDDGPSAAGARQYALRVRPVRGAGPGQLRQSLLFAVQRLARARDDVRGGGRRDRAADVAGRFTSRSRPRSCTPRSTPSISRWRAGPGDPMGEGLRLRIADSLWGDGSMTFESALPRHARRRLRRRPACGRLRGRSGAGSRRHQRLGVRPHEPEDPGALARRLDRLDDTRRPGQRDLLRRALGQSCSGWLFSGSPGGPR